MPPLKVTFGRTVKAGVIALQNTAAGYEATFETLTVAPAANRR